MRKAPRVVRVFIASPGDLAVERRAFKEVIQDLNQGFGDGARVRFEPLGWEDTLAAAGRRSQGVINEEVDRCDVFVLALNVRWGQAAPDTPPPARSYTEEEFLRAFNRWKGGPAKGKKRPAPEIFVFFKEISPQQMGDAGPQLKKVLRFRRELEKTRQVLYHTFADEHSFKREIETHLKAYVRGELPKVEASPQPIELPSEPLKELKLAHEAARKAEAEAKRNQEWAELAQARLDEIAIDHAELASRAALDGHIESARQSFAKAIQGTTNLGILYLAHEFYKRVGELDTSEGLLKRCLSICGPDSESEATAAVLGNLSLIYVKRGELDRAEETCLKSLDLHQKLNLFEGLANQFGTLGVIHEIRGDLDRSRQMILRQLRIHERIGYQNGIATGYGNLGRIHFGLGQFARAKKMHLRSLQLHEKLEDEQGMAINFSNLGAIHFAKGRLDDAAEMHLMSLRINEKLGYQEGMANDYGNLGIVYATRGDSNSAESMLSKSLEIHNELGNKEGMAADYSNLGFIAEDRGNLNQTRELWTKARDLYAEVGILPEVKARQELLDSLPTEKGSNTAARRKTELVELNRSHAKKHGKKNAKSDRPK